MSLPQNTLAAALLLAATAAPAADAPPRAPKPAASAASPAPPDPLLQLRQRLAERLRTNAQASSGTTADVRVTARTAAVVTTRAPVQHARPESRAAAPVAPRAAAHKAADTETHAPPIHWDYAGAGGPAAWGALRPEFGLCASGQRQSPIDIRGGLAVDLEPVSFNYQPSQFGVIDNGHTVQVNVGSGNHIQVGARRFELQQFHFHRPSEERIDGRQFEMSLHLVHADNQGRLAVVTVLLDKGPAQPVVQQVWNNLPLERGDESVARLALDPAGLLPADRRYYTYMGSLTTPPCREGVQWIVMRQPVTVAAEQIELFARIYPMNARPLQATSGRRILQSN